MKKLTLITTCLSGVLFTVNANANDILTFDTCLL